MLSVCLVCNGVVRLKGEVCMMMMYLFGRVIDSFVGMVLLGIFLGRVVEVIMCYDLFY